MSTSVREGASKVLDGVIKDLAEKKVALNWSPKDATDASSSLVNLQIFRLISVINI